MSMILFSNTNEMSFDSPMWLTNMLNVDVDKIRDVNDVSVLFFFVLYFSMNTQMRDVYIDD